MNTQVNRWQRYGNDRLYVALADGARIGWWDRQTQQAYPTNPDLLSTLLEAVRAWEQGIIQSQVKPPEPNNAMVAQPTMAAPLQPEDTPTWVDLAMNQAGDSARHKAREVYAAAPVRNTLRRLLGVHTAERAWRIGADGEVATGAQLARLIRKDPTWRVLHAIPVGEHGSDIDHLLMGPGGIFSINSKHHPGARIWIGGGQVHVNGKRTPYVRNSRFEANRASKLLSKVCDFPVPVMPLIVTVNAERFVVKEQPAGMMVIPRSQLRDWLRALDVLHTLAEIETVYAMARRSTTWQG